MALPTSILLYKYRVCPDTDIYIIASSLGGPGPRNLFILGLYTLYYIVSVTILAQGTDHVPQSPVLKPTQSNYRVIHH
jgi:hypothetical protein